MGWGMPGGTSKSLLLNASYHEKHEYIWFRDGDLNTFQDIKPYMKMNRVGHARAHPRGILVSVFECILS